MQRSACRGDYRLSEERRETGRSGPPTDERRRRRNVAFPIVSKTLRTPDADETTLAAIPATSLSCPSPSTSPCLHGPW